MNEIVVPIQTLYLAIVLLIAGEGLKELVFINKRMIIWILLIIGVLINFIFYGITFNTLINGIIASSISIFIYELIRQTKKTNNL